MMSSHTSLLIPKLSTLLILFTLLNWFSAFSQEALLLDWQQTHSNANGQMEMEFHSLEARNGIAYVGGFSSTIEGNRMYLVAYQSDGTMNWDLSLPSTFESRISHVLMDDAGNIYIVGTEQVGSSGMPPIHIARITNSGELVWQHTFDAEGGSDVELVWAELENEKLLLVGTEDGEGQYDIAWAAEFDLNGELQWKTSFDSGTETVFTDISANNQGAVAACGWADYGYSTLLVGFDAAGNVDWSFPETLTGANEAWFNDLTYDDNGNWIAIGTEETDELFEFDAITYKLDPGGNEIWNQRFNNTYTNYGSLVRVASDGSIRSIISMEDDSDYFVRTIAYDSNGNELWAVNHDIDLDTSVIDAEISEDNELFLGVSDFDFYGFAKISSTGVLSAFINYDESIANNYKDIAIDQNNVYVGAYLGTSTQSVFICIDQANMDEISSTMATGEAMSDVFVTKLVNDGNHVWIANTTDIEIGTADTTIFSISKLDYSGNILWTRDKRLAGLNPSFDVLEHDNSGNIIGFYENLLSGAVTDLGLIKYDADGNELFNLTYDSLTTLYTGAMVIDPSDNIYISGYSQGSKLMFLSKLDPNGNEIWTSHYESPSPTFPYAIPLKMKYSDQGKLVIAAVYKNADNVNNLHVFQYDNNGNLEWDTEVNPTSGNLVFAEGLEVDANGTIVIFGSSAVGTYVAASYDASGTELWMEAASLPSGQAPRSMTTDASGNSYLCFSTPTSAVFRKLNSDGELVISATHSISGDGTFVFPRACTILGDRLAIIGDHSTPSGNLPLEMLLDTDLNLIYANADEENPSTFRGFDQDEAGNLHATYVKGTASAGAAYREALVRSYSIGIVGIEESDITMQELRLYPNPSSSVINIEVPPSERVQDLKVLDINGKAVLTEKSTRQIDIGQLPQALYFLVVNTQSGSVYKRGFVRE